MRVSPSFRRVAGAVAAIAMLICSQAFAQSQPPPPPPPVPVPPVEVDTTALGFIHHITIGVAPCDTCPPRVCPGEPVPVTISGFLPSPCYQFRGFHERPVDAIPTLLVADFVVDTCATACPAVMVPFSASLMLPPLFQNTGEFTLRQQVRSCPDTFSVAEVHDRRYAYTVEPNCHVSPPIDTLARSFVTFEVRPRPRCPEDSLFIVLKTTGCYPCVHLSSFTQDPVEGFVAAVSWRPLCPELGCGVEALSLPLGQLAAGFHTLNVRVDVNVLRAPGPDTLISYRERVNFEVGLNCSTSVCVEPALPPRGELGRVCAATVSPGGIAEVTMPMKTGSPLWGAEGWLYESFPLRILDIEYAGTTPGTFLTWHRDGQQVRFVTFTIGERPMVPVGSSGLLRVRFQVDPAVDPGQSIAHLAGRLEQVAGRNGETLPFCPEPFRSLPPALAICIFPRPDTCDANGDGRADVRDLVRMVSCLYSDSAGADTTARRACQDCNKDGGFDLNDLFCCARHILHAPQLPTDSAQVSDGLRVAFGTLRREGAGWRVPVRVTGADRLAGSLLRLRFPADRWRADVPYGLDSRTDVNTGWMPIVDVAEPGVAQLGWLKLGEGDPSELVFELALNPIGEPLPGDEISVEGADLVGADGASLKPAESLPVASLISPLEPPQDLPVEVAFAPARPNPFMDVTRFSVSLPRESLVELTVHDVAGRVVATLARGRFAAGVREFTWDGAGARGGVYFARLSVDGRVMSQRVALLRGGH